MHLDLPDRNARPDAAAAARPWANWHESSWELRCGLEIREAWADDEAHLAQREVPRNASCTAAPRSITAIA